MVAAAAVTAADNIEFDLASVHSQADAGSCAGQRGHTVGLGKPGHIAT